MRRAWLLVAWLASSGAVAHPLAPALLQLRETAPETYEVEWRTSVARARGGDVAPALPPECTEIARQRPVIENAEALVARATLHCAGGLAGRRIGVSGLAGSGINAIVRIETFTGEVSTQLLDARQDGITVPQKPSAFRGYFVLGVEHLWLGVDHVLFVTGLVLLLVRKLRALVVTVTAFTLGHSLTLALATLGLVAVKAPLMELGIALSVLALAAELARPAAAKPGLLARWPAAMAAGFGLLHGLGFAGALGEIGLPPGDIPLALFAFNLGIEAGQLALIALLLSAAALVRGLPQPVLARTATVYLIGSLGAYWCVERGAILMTS